VKFVEQYTMSIRVGIYLLLIVVGLVVLAWPEQDDQMMIRFSETHGPSGLDSVGIVILLGGYILLIIPVFTKFSKIHQVAGRIFSRLLVVIAVICSLLICVALMIGNEFLLWLAAVISTTAQAILIYFAARKRV
jgi:uncharacterized membrane protein